jgi:4-diphosphocytidyl-2-C-methyl-D-erythritol kinase
MLQKRSPCKINLLLNVLQRREDGFHALETVMLPIPLYDIITFVKEEKEGIRLSIEGAELSNGPDNLIFQAASAFYKQTKLKAALSIQLYKKTPMEAGLGGGSSNAGTTLRALNNMYDNPLDQLILRKIAATLGSDVPFFLQDNPALASGRGESIKPLPPFQALKGKGLLLVKPGFGVATAWAYQHLKRFPTQLNGQTGQGQKLVQALSKPSLEEAAPLFLNSLEGPALEKYPILKLYQSTLRTMGAEVTLMSGSGSTTFAIFPSKVAADRASKQFVTNLGNANWLQVLEL